MLKFTSKKWLPVHHHGLLYKSIGFLQKLGQKPWTIPASSLVCPDHTLPASSLPASSLVCPDHTLLHTCKWSGVSRPHPTRKQSGVSRPYPTTYLQVVWCVQTTPYYIPASGLGCPGAQWPAPGGSAGVGLMASAAARWRSEWQPPSTSSEADTSEPGWCWR